MFNFVPKILFISGRYSRNTETNNSWWGGDAILNCILGSGFTLTPDGIKYATGAYDCINRVNRYIGHPVINLSGNTVSWYITTGTGGDATSSLMQMNSAGYDNNIGICYQYVAVG